VTLVSSIITDAYRESNMLPLGKVPTANQTTEALRLYNALIDAIYGGDAGERLTDWPLGNFERDPNGCDYIMPFSDHRLHHPPINQRLIAVNLAAATIWLTTRPQDGSRMGVADPFSRLSDVPLTIDGNGRPIEGTASIVLNTDGIFREWFYRADLAAWVRLTDLAADDENPFPAAYDNMFMILLAMRLNPRYGRTLDDQSIAALKRNRQEFINRYLQSRPLEIDDSISWPFMSTQGYDTQRAFTSQGGFNRGRPYG
jgi:hypothetical protein